MLWLLSCSTPGFYREFSCPGFCYSFLTAPLPFQSCLHSLPVTQSCKGRAKGRLGAQATKCQRAQSKDHILTAHS